MTDDLEPRLRQHLQRTAGRTEPVPDPADLDARIGARHRRTTRGLGVALTLALAAGPLAGWTLARSTEPDVQAVSAAGTGASDRDDGVDEPLLYAQGSGYLDYLGGVLPLVSDRTTGEGLRLVTRLGTIHGSYPGGGVAPCVTDGLARVGVTDGELVGVVSSEVAPASRTFGVTGAAEGQPVWVVIARADGGTVEARFPNGTTDRAEAVGGLAVLAAYADAIPTDLIDDVIEVSGLPGGAADAEDPAQVTSYLQGHGPCPGGTTAGEVMPEPGEPPSDEVAARAAITDTFLAAYGGPGTEEKAHLYERPDVWLAANAAFRQNEEYLAMAETISAEVQEIVFTAPDRASVRFVLESSESGTPTPGEQVGEAVLIDGAWKVSIETSCGLLAMGGVECDR